MSDAITDLERIRRNRKRHAKLVETDLVETNEAVRRAVREGHSYRKIAAAAGISFQRVGQIIEKEEK